MSDKIIKYSSTDRDLISGDIQPEDHESDVFSLRPTHLDDYVGQFEPPIILDIDPEDGAGDVDRNSGVIIRFSQTMDTASVSANCFVIGGSEMRQCLDSLSHAHGGGYAGDCPDSCMMNWLDTVCCEGQFHWNGSLDSCVFQPDSVLRANEDHMVYLTGPIRSHTGMPMAMDTSEYGGFVSYFRTGP